MRTPDPRTGQGLQIVEPLSRLSPALSVVWFTMGGRAVTNVGGEEP